MKKENVLLTKSFAFAIRIVKLYRYLTSKKDEYVLSKQLLRSGTSIGANVRECNNAESSGDFIHKLGIAQKECDETMYWLELMNATEFINNKEFQSIIEDADQLLKIIKSSILTMKRKLKK